MGGLNDAADVAVRFVAARASSDRNDGSSGMGDLETSAHALLESYRDCEVERRRALEVLLIGWRDDPSSASSSSSRSCGQTGAVYEASTVVGRSRGDALSALVAGDFERLRALRTGHDQAFGIVDRAAREVGGFAMMDASVGRSRDPIGGPVAPGYASAVRPPPLPRLLDPMPIHQPSDAFSFGGLAVGPCRGSGEAPQHELEEAARCYDAMSAELQENMKCLSHLEVALFDVPEL